MFKKSRRKIVTAIMSILVLLWVGTLGIIYISSYFEMSKQNVQMLKAHSGMYVLTKSTNNIPTDIPAPNGNNPGFEQGFAESPMFRLSTFYTVALSYDGKILETKNEPPTVYSDDDLERLAQKIINSDNEVGTENNLVFYKADKGGYLVVTFMDNTVINEKGLYLEALNCSGNQLEPSDTGREHEAVVYKTFQLAELLGVKKIVMMSGLPGGGPDSPYPVWVTNTWPHNFTDMLNYQWDSIAIPWWKEAAKKASSHGIEQIAIENHPNNLVYNVSTIRRLHEEAGEIIGLNLDPSHSFYMGGDPIIMAKKLATDGLIYHVHGKDTRIEKDIADTEMLFETCDHMAPQNIRPWNYVAVGYGHDQLWWKTFIAALKMNGYDGVVSIEVGDTLMDDITAISKSAEFLKKVLI